MKAPSKAMTAEDLRKNMLRTYFTLRIGIVLLSAVLPLILYGYTLTTHGGLTVGSMSAFYGVDAFAMRNWFVGILWAVGSFLALYKGFSALEDWLLNFAGIFVVLTAMRSCNCWDEAAVKDNLHTVFAVMFFVSMAAVCLFCARDTITLLPKARQRRFTRTYYIIGVVLFLSPLAAVAVAFFVGASDSRVFFIEWFAVWVFAAHWFVKSAEFRITSAEKRAVYGELRNVRGVGVVPAAAAVEQPADMSRQ